MGPHTTRVLSLFKRTNPLAWAGHVQYWLRNGVHQRARSPLTRFEGTKQGKDEGSNDSTSHSLASIFDVEEVANAFIRGQKHGHGARGAETSDAAPSHCERSRGERQRKGGYLCIAALICRTDSYIGIIISNTAARLG